jgi:two-component system sensor histidine kinase AlgZ
MSLPAAHAHAMPVRPAVEVVIPDCCNIGVIFRSLFMANVSVLLACLARAATLRAGLADFVELSLLLELAVLCSLLALCGLRRLIQAASPWAQRAGCALVPAAVTALLIRFLASLELFGDRFGGSMVSDAMVSGTMVSGILTAALFGILLQHYFELRNRAFSPALAEARLQALQARIQPHFLFNSLNAVLSLIRSQPRAAETALEDLADLFRVLIRDAGAMSSLQEELALCRKYLAIERIRLGERLQVEWDLAGIDDTTLRNARIPALLLQPLLENAVHHGVEPRIDATPIQVVMGRTLDRISIVVTNAVRPDAALDRGAIPGGGNRMALDNIRERLALLYDVEAQLNTRVVDGLFEVRLHLPYRKTA